MEIRRGKARIWHSVTALPKPADCVFRFRALSARENYVLTGMLVYGMPDATSTAVSGNKECFYLRASQPPAQ